MNHHHSADVSTRVKSLVAELERANLLTEAQLDETVEQFLLHAKPANGFRVVARAWADPEFKARLLADANAALGELGIDLKHWAPVRLRAVENTEQQHNLIVCTLCSCYPIALLGPSPPWYKSEAYRSRAVIDPRGVLAEFGVTLPESTHVTVWDSTAEVRYIVIPRRPPGTKGLSEEALAAQVTRNGLIGTALV
ncbi:MAG: nitrile hydratase subunit alpha [Vulcanimicrobiaceae bacterium]